MQDHQNLYSVYDVKADRYLPPYSAVGDGMAIRAFSNAVFDTDSDFHKHSTDFSLWRVGTWDQTKGVPATSKKECVAQAHELLTQLTLELQEQNNSTPPF